MRLREPVRGGAADSHRVEGDAMRREGRAWHFELPKVQPGTYDLTVGFHGYHRVVKVAPGRDADVRIDLPQPARVTVRVIDTSTGKPAPLDSISFRPMDGKGRFGGDTIHIDRGKGKDAFEFNAAPGWIQIWVFEEGWGFAVRPLEIAPGKNEHTIRISPALAFEIVLLEGDTPVPWPTEKSPKITAVGGEGRSTGATWGDDGTRFFVDRPGVYRAEIPDLEGYLPVPAQEIRVEKGKVTRHEVRLVRKR
jgi:hypothetical protein